MNLAVAWFQLSYKVGIRVSANGKGGLSGNPAVKMIAEYLEHALNFERMAADEKNPEIKAVFEKQAAAYRKLIADRNRQFGLDDPRYLSKDE